MNAKMVCSKMPVFVFLFLGMLLPLHAQEWERELFFGLNFTEGNSDILAGNLKFEARKEDGINLDFSSFYGRSGGERNVDRSSASARWRRDLGRRAYTGLSFSAGRDTIAAVDYRYMLSPVLGKRVIDSEAASLSMEAGPAYIIESLAGEKASGFALRMFELFERELGGASRLRQSLEYTVREGDGYLVGFELGVVSALTSRMNLRAALELDYDSSPAEERKKYDLALITSLGFSF